MESQSFVVPSLTAVLLALGQFSYAAPVTIDDVERHTTTAEFVQHGDNVFTAAAFVEYQPVSSRRQRVTTVEFVVAPEIADRLVALNGYLYYNGGDGMVRIGRKIAQNVFLPTGRGHVDCIEFVNGHSLTIETCNVTIN